MGACEPLELAEPSLVGVAGGQQVVDVGQRLVGRGGSAVVGTRERAAQLDREFHWLDSWREMTHRGSLGVEPGGWDWGWVRKTCWEEARRVLGPSAAAEDAAQEAAIKAWRHHASCRTPEHPRPWLAAIARREAFRLRGPPRAESLETAAEPSVAATDAAWPSPSTSAARSPSSPRATGSCCWRVIGAICRNTRSRTCSECRPARLRSGSTACAHVCAPPSASHRAANVRCDSGGTHPTKSRNSPRYARSHG